MVLKDRIMKNGILCGLVGMMLFPFLGNAQSIININETAPLAAAIALQTSVIKQIHEEREKQHNELRATEAAIAANLNWLHSQESIYGDYLKNESGFGLDQLATLKRIGTMVTITIPDAMKALKNSVPLKDRNSTLGLIVDKKCIEYGTTMLDLFAYMKPIITTGNVNGIKTQLLSSEERFNVVTKVEEKLNNILSDINATMYRVIVADPSLGVQQVAKKIYKKTETPQNAVKNAADSFARSISK